MDNPKIPHIADYDTGYKKPPKASQFKKGKSGNPSGRPKGALNKLPKDELRLQDLFIKEVYRDVTIKEGSKRIKLPVMQAVLRSIMLNAAQGKERGFGSRYQPETPDDYCLCHFWPMRGIGWGDYRFALWHGAGLGLAICFASGNCRGVYRRGEYSGR